VVVGKTGRRSVGEKTTTMVPSSLSCSVATKSMRQLQLSMDIGDSFSLSTVHHELTRQPNATRQGGCLRYVMSAIVPSSQIGRHVSDIVTHKLLYF
jgi:hypothetical protein